MSEELHRLARSFGGNAEAYDRGRPTYAADAATWLCGPHGAEPLTVLELGAGTGKLTRGLVERGHDVHATEPDRAMLDLLEQRLPGVRTSLSGAEEIPVPDRSVDVVVAAQSFHWFDAEQALPEIARVLKPGGYVSLVWNERDERIPWVRRLGKIIGSQERLADPTGLLDESGLYWAVEQQTFAHWQVVDRRTIVDLVRSRSNIAALEEAEREERLAAVLALYDDYGRGMDGMQVPYRARCFRARVSDRPEPLPEPVESVERPADRPASITDTADTLPRIAGSIHDDTGMLLIDFR